MRSVFEQNSMWSFGVSRNGAILLVRSLLDLISAPRYSPGSSIRRLLAAILFSNEPTLITRGPRFQECTPVWLLVSGRS